MVQCLSNANLKSFSASGVAWSCVTAVGRVLRTLPAGIWTLGRAASHPAWGYTELETHSGSGLLVQPQS